jgi:SpoVK/Ycf46/Vps4 family AAA+-type ATPase
MSLKGPDLKAGYVGQSGQYVKAVWEKARARGRCVIFVDECEGVFGRRGSTDTDQLSEELVQAFLAEWDGMDSEGQRVWVIGATNRRELLDDAIVSRFGRGNDIEIGLPDAAARLQILRLELLKLGYEPAVPAVVGGSTQGFSGRNLADLARDVGTLADERGGGLNEEMWSEVIRRYAKGASETVDQGARWDSLVLAPATLDTLQTVCDSLKYLETLREQGLEIPKGALLFGPPGTGKTQIARTIANESGLPFIAATTADLKMGYTGQSGQKVRELFERARATAPCIVFIDELESVAPIRGGPSSDQFTTEIVTQLLQEMDGVRSHPRHVFVLGATNLVGAIDPALLSRFEEKVEIPLPDAEQRRELFRLFLCRQKRLDLDVDQLAGELAMRAGDIGGRDIRNLVQRASQIAVRRALKARTPDRVTLSRDDFNSALGSTLQA